MGDAQRMCPGNPRHGEMSVDRQRLLLSFSFDASSHKCSKLDFQDDTVEDLRDVVPHGYRTDNARG